eukprot:SM000039S14497  [mRNA]  locus=s39:391996:394293:- [translate_table: standard]
MQHRPKPQTLESIDCGCRDNGSLASCGGDRQVFLWDVATTRVVRKFRGHDGEVRIPTSLSLLARVNAVKFSDTSAVVVTGGYDRSVRAWDCRSRSIDPIQVIDPFSDSVSSVALTKSEIVAGSIDGSVRSLDIRMGRVVSDHLGRPVTSVSLSNDGNCVLAGYLDSTVRLLDKASGELLNEYKGHVNESYKLDSCLSNTDAHVISGSEDGRICFWDLVDARMTSIKGHTAAVTGVSYHPKECCLLSSSVDGSVAVWKR